VKIILLLQNIKTTNINIGQNLGQISKMNKFNLLIIVATGFLAGCASRAENISAAYVSPFQYEKYSCDQLREEAGRISSRAAQVAGLQDTKATNDAVATGVGVIIFWPALFLIKGDATTGAELARLKGEMEAIEKVSITKKCNIQFQNRTS
jgi:hypothetical protein